MSETRLSKENEVQEVAAIDPMYDVIPKTVWLRTSNIDKEDYLTLSLEINGQEHQVEQIYIPGLDRGEGIHLCSRNLTWLLKNNRTLALDKEKLVEWIETQKRNHNTAIVSRLLVKIVAGEFDL